MSTFIHRIAGAALSSALAFVSANPAWAKNDFTAKAVMEKMKVEERYPYIAGVVEGLAYARYVRDDKKTAGMECIYDWFYEKPGTLDMIYAALGRYGDFPPGAIIAGLAKQNCGE